MSENNTLLVVDDEPRYVQLVQVNLETAGYEVETAHVEHQGVGQGSIGTGVAHGSKSTKRYDETSALQFDFNARFRWMSRQGVYQV